MWQEPRCLWVNFSLDVKMAHLAKWQKIPPSIIRLVAIEVMSCEYSPRHGWTAATDALVANSLSGLASFLLPVWVVVVGKPSQMTFPGLNCNSGKCTVAHSLNSFLFLICDGAMPSCSLLAQAGIWNW